MNSELYASLALSGLSLGVIYAMIAMGLILLIKAVGVLNFAQGDFLALGALLGVAFYADLNFRCGLPLLCVY